MILFPVEEPVFIPVRGMDGHMCPSDCANAPRLAVRALVMREGIGVLGFFVWGKMMCSPFIAFRKFVTSSTQVDIQPLVVPWESAISLKELPVE